MLNYRKTAYKNTISLTFKINFHVKTKVHNEFPT